MTQYSYKELREALTRASAAHGGININGVEDIWSRNEMVQLHTILDYLPEKTTASQVGDKIRSDAWVAVLEHPYFKKERWGDKPVHQAILNKLDELHRGPLPTEYGSVIKNVVIHSDGIFVEEYPFMQLSNTGWMGVTKRGVFSGAVSGNDITTWEPFDSE